MPQIHELTLIDLASAIRNRQLSPVEVSNHYLGRIDELNAQVGAFFTVSAELAGEQARAAEKAVTSAPDAAALPPLLGVPIPIKDLNMVAGVRQTFGSAVYEDYVASDDDYIVSAIRAAGAVITGKTATPEFGLPCYTETKIGPPAHPVGSDPVGRRLQRRRRGRSGRAAGSGRPGQ